VTDTDTARDALSFNEIPMAVNIFPSGDGYDEGSIPAGRVPFLTLSQDSPVILTALKKTEDGRDTLIRLFNPTAKEAAVTVKCPSLEVCETLTLGTYEAATYRVRDGKLIPSRMDEKEFPS
jgi:alpha-mannosidase